MPASKTTDELVDKKHAAVVVEISRPSVQDAVRFLQKCKLDTNLVVITTAKGSDQSMVGLDENNPQRWFEIVQEFNTAINAIKTGLGYAHMHIFLATPVALAFGEELFASAGDSARFKGQSK